MESNINWARWKPSGSRENSSESSGSEKCTVQSSTKQQTLWGNDASLSTARADEASPR